MADQGGGYRGGGRKGHHRNHPYTSDHHSNTSKDGNRDRDRERSSRGGGGGGSRGGGDRDRSKNTYDRKDRNTDDRRERRPDDRDKVSKSRHDRSSNPNKSGLGFNSPRPASSHDANASSNAPTAPKGRFEPAREKEAEKSKPVEVGAMEIDDDEDSEAEMKRVLGFGKFKTTKNTKIPGNEFMYAVAKAKQTKYRQYMNRQGGFNRPLSPPR